MRILVTGAAGFIGYHLSTKLLARGDQVTGIDNLNDYYDVSLKEARLALLERDKGFCFLRHDIADRAGMADIFAGERFDCVVNLAAQAGVRYSLVNPHAYVDANISGFLNILEGVRHHGGHLVFASSSSVYGGNTKLPFSEKDSVDHPVSLYAATKRANELMAHSYSHLFGVRATGLRFFTVYGPWGRPDMALFLFTKGILAGEPIPVFNEGRMVRDFTYIDDIIEGVVRVIDNPAAPDPAWESDHPTPATSRAPWRIFNIGNNKRVELMAYIRAIEKALGREAKLDLLPMQAGDVQATEADTSLLSAAVGFRPDTPVEEGVRRFVEWYLDYYGDGLRSPSPNSAAIK
jgi:UDP-glucuronate 4-epimerase